MGDLALSNRIRGVLLVGQDGIYQDEAAEICKVNVSDAGDNDLDLGDTRKGARSLE